MRSGQSLQVATNRKSTVALDELQTTVVGKPLPPVKTEAEERKQTIALFTATMVIATIQKKYNIVALCKSALNKIAEATKLGKKNSHKVGFTFGGHRKTRIYKRRMRIRQRRKSQLDKVGLDSKKQNFMDSIEGRCFKSKALRVMLVKSKDTKVH